MIVRLDLEYGRKNVSKCIFEFFQNRIKTSILLAILGLEINNLQNNWINFTDNFENLKKNGSQIKFVQKSNKKANINSPSEFKFLKL